MSKSFILPAVNYRGSLPIFSRIFTILAVLSLAFGSLNCHAPCPRGDLRGDLRGAASPAQWRGTLARSAVPHTHVPVDSEPAEAF